MVNGVQPFADRSVSAFRIRVFLAVSLVIVALTVGGVLILEQRLTREAERRVEAGVEQMLAAHAATRSHRQEMLTGLCEALARKPRIQAALEDDALDLLYASARQEIRQLFPDLAAGAEPTSLLQARFHRFLDAQGRLIPPPTNHDAGPLDARTESALALSAPPGEPQVGYLVLASPARSEAVEVLTVPIISLATFRPIAALAMGFPMDLAPPPSGEREALVVAFSQDGLIALRGAPSALRPSLLDTLADPALVAAPPEELAIAGTAFRLIVHPLNEGLPYPPATEWIFTSMEPLVTQKRALRRQVLLGGCVLLAGALVTSRFLSQRLSRPVEALARASKHEHHQRLEAEAALDQTSRELERTARFSADASHQLKTPISVLRLGLEELRGAPTLAPELRDEVSDLIRQTHRLNAVIEDLLLLARIDSGHLRLRLEPLSLHHLVEAMLDDFSVLPDAFDLSLDYHSAESATVLGERRHLMLILQNLLENARKYNRPHGRIEVVLKTSEPHVRLRLGNTGTPIPAASQAHIFERFHRGAVAEQVPGYGLGLNLARDLARLHGGELNLVRSHDDWTEFELILPRAAAPVS